jgi:hypothetical protein
VWISTLGPILLDSVTTQSPIDSPASMSSSGIFDRRPPYQVPGGSVVTAHRLGRNLLPAPAMVLDRRALISSDVVLS